MGTEATQVAIQAGIDASQTADAIEYGVRSIKLCGHPYGCSPCHMAQITAGCQAATRVLGRFVAQDAGTLRQLRAAKAEAAAQVKAADAAVRAFGTKRQLRLALAA